PEDFPKNALGIMDTATGQVTKVDGVKSFQVPDDGGGYVAILKEAAREERPAANPNSNTANANTAAPATGAPQTPNRPRERRKEYGSALILRRLSDGNSRTFADVLDYTFSKDAKTLVFGVAS